MRTARDDAPQAYPNEAAEVLLSAITTQAYEELP
jgi:hypothetical protein